MAEQTILNPYFTPSVKAAGDLSSHIYKAVRYDSGGVRLATQHIGSGPGYILMNDPKSGQACALNVAGNITKAVAGTAVAIGQPCIIGTSATLYATSATFIAGSDGGGVLLMGYADTACASGELFNLRLV